ncbi:hypothetical protein [Agromyces aerolatus]|uniref:hypothetical protein n=1 Tax=Agromyces sp. LY-1074 TaxID=3074080 RepID=UPI0028547C9A|nr:MULTISPECIES: hypothetical protein [unclassified Agromyces]MDR5699619.1 hypothetical protein [Agromyces sp. LY-1074]MDR5705915.1 hypothetical protein [Agromyces sp. LY-1358]
MIAFPGPHLLIVLLYWAVIGAAIFGLVYLAARLAFVHALHKHGLIPPAPGRSAPPATDDPA